MKPGSFHSPTRHVIRVLAVVAAFLLVATPMAGAMGFGVNNSAYNEARESGWTPEYGQFWIGKWSNGNWLYMEQQLELAKKQGVTPVIEWYYWGDAISPNCVQYGCGGMSRGEWWSMGDHISKRVNAIMGDRPVIFVLETEFNKGGMENHEGFDNMLRDHINMMKRNAPNAKFAVGFGNWNHHNFGNFDQAMSAADYAGLQMMRGITKDSWDHYNKAAQSTLDGAKALQRTFGKPVIIHDIALSSYRTDLQDKVLRDLASRQGEFEQAGVFGMVYREVRDYNGACTCWYYGEAERHFGLKTASGGAKSAWWTWTNMAKSSSGGALPGGSPSEPAPSEPAPSGDLKATFTPKNGNEWWVQVSVDADRSLSGVDARVDGGSWVKLDQHSWGYAKSMRVPDGSLVEFRARATDGTSVTSGKYVWPAGTATSDAGDAVSGLTATFSPRNGNSWWVQTSVDADRSLRSVEARVDGGSWVALDKHSWGWAKSMRAPDGSKVQFRATATDGSTKISGEYVWPSATPVGADGFTATFNPRNGNTWWIQTDVSANKDVRSVETRVNGGSWIKMDAYSWGYAKSVHAPSGSKVEFRATSTSGSTVTSPTYTWPR